MQIVIYYLFDSRIGFVLPNIKPVPVIAASKASYEIINKKEIRKYKNMSAKYLYQLPQLKGNSAAIKKINKSLRADYKKTLSGKESLFEYFEETNIILFVRIMVRNIMTQ